MRTRPARTRMTTHAVLLAAASLAIVAGTSVSLAEPPPPPPGSPLGGPAVEDTTPPGGAKTFDGERHRGQAPGLELRELGAQVRRLGGPDAPEGLALSEQQRQDLRTILNDYRGAMRAFFRANEEEITALRERAGLPPMRAQRTQRGERGERGERGRRRGGDSERPRDGMDGPPEGMDGPEGRRGGPAAGERGERGAPTPEQAEAREALAKLMAKGPSAADTSKKIYAVLTPEQRAHVEREMKKAAERRAEARKRGAADGGMGVEDLPPRVRERLESLSPEEREEAIRRWRERRGERDGARERRRARPGAERNDEGEI